MAPTDPHPRQVGLVLSAAETDRLRGVLGGAGRTLAVDEDDRAVPAAQRLAPELDQAEHDLTRRLHRAEQASVRLDVPVRLTPAETATVLGLLKQAATRLDAYVTRREQGDFLLGPAWFREQAAAVHAWHTDLAGLAERQHHRAGSQPPRRRGEAER
jgi:hypothetical protein